MIIAEGDKRTLTGKKGNGKITSTFQSRAGMYRLINRKERGLGVSMRLTKKQLIGLFIVLFGISIFLQNSGLGDALFWPLAFLFAGYFFHKIPAVGSGLSCIFLQAFCC